VSTPPRRLPARGARLDAAEGAAAVTFRSPLQLQLVMTPQLQQAIRLLQLSRDELIAEIQQELASNPLLCDENVDPRPGLDEPALAPGAPRRPER
jgi:hypothetical protein